MIARRFIVAILGFVGMCDWTRADSHFYTYYKERIALGIDGGQIAVFRADFATPDQSAVRSLGIGADAATPHTSPGWSILTMPNAAMTDADIDERVAIVAASESVDFVSPVLVDPMGLPCLILSNIMVRFAATVSADEAEQILADAGAAEIVDRNWGEMPGVYRVRTGSKNGLEVLRVANALAGRADVEFAEPACISRGELSVIPNDEYFSNLWALNNTGQTGGIADADMNCIQAWDAPSGFGSATIRVLIMDVGIQQNHPDINQAPGLDFTGQNSPGGGPVVANDNHGTNVAGCVSAIANNTTGVCGAAPGVISVSAKIGNELANGGLQGDIVTAMVNALTWGQANNCRITNASLSLGMPSAALDTKYAQTKAAGMIHFGATGNGAPQANFVSYPARLPTVIAVGAIKNTGQRTDFSQFGPELDIVAPGEQLLTTDRTGADGYDPSDYTWLVNGQGIPQGQSGTSFACPYAAGVAALMLSANPNLTPDQVQNILQSTARDLGAPGFDNEYGHGLVRADTAVAAANGGGGVPANDSCENAAALVSGVAATGSTLNATTDGAASCDVNGRSGKDVWFSFTPAQAGTVTIQTCGSAFDTVLSVHTGACGGLTQVACNDDHGGLAPCTAEATRSFISMTMNAGTQYRIRLAGFDNGAGPEGGSYTILLAGGGGGGGVPANDNCANATALVSGVAATGSTSNATTDGVGIANCDINGESGKDVWFTFTPAQTGTVTIKTCGSAFDTVLSVYTGACGALTRIGCDNDGGEVPCGQPLMSNLSLAMNAGTQYRIRLAGIMNAGGTVDSGNYTILLTAGGGPPVNDACANAVLLVSGVAATGSNVAATDDPAGFSVCGGGVIGKDVWFRYVPACSGIVTINACGSDFDTVLSVNVGACNALTEVVCNDDAQTGTPCGDPPTGPSYIQMPMTAGIEYRIFLAGTDFGGSGTGNYSVLLTAAGGAVPPAPTNVAATDALCDGVTVSWTASTGATGYQVWRNTANNSGTASQIATPSASPYDDRTAAQGVSYFYWVRAAGVCDASAFSNSDAGARGTTPAAPANIAASDALCDRVTVSWTASPGATGYQVWRHTTNDSGAAQLLAAGPASPFDDANTTVGTTYYYWVKAISGCGASGFSNSDGGARGIAPTAPTGVAASDALCDRVTVTWTASAGATSYQVWRHTANDSATAQLLAAGPASPFDDVNATPGTTYYYWVKATSGCGTSGLSTVDTGARGATPVAPTNVVATDSLCDRVTVMWTAPAGAAGHLVWRNTTNNSATAVQIATPAAPPYDDVTAVAGQAYFYWVAASGACGTSALSNSDAGILGELAAPTAAQASNGSFTDRITVSWSAVPGAVEYQVYRGTSAIGGWRSATTYEDAGLAQCTTSTYQVKARSANCESELSAIVEGRTRCDSTITWYRDADGDGYGNPGLTAQAAQAPSGFVANADDCDDDSALRHPGAAEECDGADNDCDGQVDEGDVCITPRTWFQDADGDGFGNRSAPTQAGQRPTGYVASSSDCDDGDATIHPGVPDCADAPDGVDNDCDGRFDNTQNCQTPPELDSDNDGVADADDECPEVPGSLPNGCPQVGGGACSATAVGLIGLTIVGLIRSRRLPRGPGREHPHID